MKKVLFPICLTFLFVNLSLQLIASSQSVIAAGGETEKSKPAHITYSSGLTKAEIESALGRKMSFMEHVGFKLNKKKFVRITNEATKKAESDSTNTWAIVGFVTSLLIAPLGIIFSAIALSQIKKSGEKGKGLATAGLVIGIVFTVFGLISVL